MPGDGTAREVAPGRLAGFEDGGLPDEEIPALPPRRRARPAERLATADTSNADAVTRASSPPASAGALPATPPAASPERGRRGGPVDDTDRLRPSNVHIPVSLVEPVSARCKQDGLSHGDLIIKAIEETYDRLPELIHPVSTAGGALFASRRARVSRVAEGPLTPLNYRLRGSDFVVLDQLVEQMNASSRGQLITAALSAYLG